MSPNDANKQNTSKQKDTGYQDPTARSTDAETDSEQASMESFDTPDEKLGEDAAASEAQSTPEGVGRDLLDVKDKIQAMLRDSALNGVQTMDAAGSSNIVGVGIGLGQTQGTAGSLSAGIIPGEHALTVFVRELSSVDAVKSVLADSLGASALSEDSFPLNIVETGLIEARANTARVRPAPAGFSVGHFKVTAGTIGVFCRGNSAPRNSRVMILSNNHVLANVNLGVYGDCITQPGNYDGGRCPADQVAILERFVPINFASGASNVVDCATGWTWHERVRNDMGYQSGSSIVYFRISSTPVNPSVGLLVGKTGRTTGLTEGRITATNVAVNVSYGSGRVAHFVNQFSAQSLTAAPFSAGGDSGSCIWTWNGARNPVGLLFAGGGAITFANPIRSVLAALDVYLTT